MGGTYSAAASVPRASKVQGSKRMPCLTGVVGQNGMLTGQVNIKYPYIYMSPTLLPTPIGINIYLDLNRITSLKLMHRALRVTSLIIV